jgi:hypothetical protein
MSKNEKPPQEVIKIRGEDMEKYKRMMKDVAAGKLSPEYVKNEMKQTKERK